MNRKGTDLIGKKFGKLTVIQFAGMSAKGRSFWLCSCECGGQPTVRRPALLSGSTRSCGCLIHSRTINEVGNKYGHLLVVKRNGYAKNGKPAWECICDCGNITTVRGSSLRSGATKSCGCLIGENLKIDANRSNNITHGFSSHRLYGIWQGMKKRCTNKKSDNYQYYGGRGIAVSADWHDFKTFYVDVIDLYDLHIELHGEDNTWIDRIDNNGDYSKSNYKFSTIMEQSNNKSNNRKFLYLGEMLTTPAISRATGIPWAYLYRRLVTGNTVEEIIKMRKTFTKKGD